MNRLIYIVFIFFFAFASNVFAQVELIVDSAKVSNVVELCPNNMMTSHFGDGPIINYYFSLKNNSDSTIVLNVNKTKVVCVYENNNEIYNKTLFLYPRIESNDYYSKGIIEIQPHETKGFHDAFLMVLNYESVEFNNYYVVDHTLSLMNVLTSMKVKLYIEEKETSEIIINNVLIDEKRFLTNEYSSFDDK